MTEYKYNTDFWVMHPAEEINPAIAKLPLAQEIPIFDGQGEQIEDYKAIVVNGNVVDVPSKDYVLKQHEDAFRPIINGLTVSGVQDFQFSMWATDKRAQLNIYVGEAVDGVKFGFQAKNSFNRSTHMGFNFSAQQKSVSVEVVEKDHVLVWGIRQVCTNGMVIKVPLKTTKYLDSVEVVKVKTLLSQNSRIMHKGRNVDSKLESMQFIVEAFLLLKNPLDKMIIDAKNYALTPEKAKEFILKYVGKRRLDKYMELYGNEEQTLWGLYNSVTFLASHQEEKLSENAREGLVLKAADMLTAELTIQ